MRTAAATRHLFPLFLVLTSCHAEPDDALPPPPKPAAVPKKLSATPPEPCTSKDDPAIEAPFTDNFDRTDLGSDWRSTSYGAYFLKAGRLCIAKPRNHPLWLKRKLPTNVRVEFDATPTSANGDVKAELFGDGCAFDVEGRDYTATSYVAVLGAHNNSEHWLVRLFEHGTDAKKTPVIAGAPSIATGKLAVNQTYHFELSRTDGHTFQFRVDGTPIFDFDDKEPLTGVGHDHFAFNGWDAPACFDKLTITPL